MAREKYKGRVRFDLQQGAHVLSPKLFTSCLLHPPSPHLFLSSLQLCPPLVYHPIINQKKNLNSTKQNVTTTIPQLPTLPTPLPQPPQHCTIPALSVFSFFLSYIPSSSFANRRGVLSVVPSSVSKTIFPSLFSAFRSINRKINKIGREMPTCDDDREGRREGEDREERSRR